ncbi:hypothetical protein QUR44_24315, partial [Salmonella enterica]
AGVAFGSGCGPGPPRRFSMLSSGLLANDSRLLVIGFRRLAGCGPVLPALHACLRTRDGETTLPSGTGLTGKTPG